MKKFIIAIVFSSMFSCSEEKKTPEYVWSEDRFIEVLTEFQITEAIVRLGYHRNNDSIYYNDSLYNAMFRKLEISRSDFDSNYNYYLRDPEAFSKLYERVITNLSQRAAELEPKKEKKSNKTENNTK